MTCSPQLVRHIVVFFLWCHYFFYIFLFHHLLSFRFINFVLPVADGCVFVAGSVIWAKQIEAQLDTYMKRVESVLGPEWEKHPEGMRLKQESDGFRKKLDTEAV